MRLLVADRLVAVGDSLWVLDSVQPVAVVLDPTTGTRWGLVSWPQLPPGDLSEDAGVPAVGDSTSLWVQAGSRGGPGVRVDLSGVIGAFDVPVPLVAAGAGAAWCAHAFGPDAYPLQSETDPSVDALPAGSLVRLDPDGSVTTVRTPAPVTDVVVDGDVVRVGVMTGAHARQVAPGWWTLLPATGWLTLPAGAMPEELTLDASAPWTRADRGTHGDVGWYRGPGTDTTWDRGHSPVYAGGLRWYVGWPSPEDPALPVEEGTVARVIMAAADEPWVEPRARVPVDDRDDGRMVARPLRTTAVDADGAVVREVDLGRGWVQGICPLPGALAVSVRRPVPVGAPDAEVVRIDVESGRVTVLMAPEDAPDIQALRWPVDPPGAAEAAHVDAQLGVCRGLDRYWNGTEHRRAPQDLITDLAVSSEGTWPDIDAVATFRHGARPGLQLRRRWRLFDEIGEPQEVELWAFEEDLSTGHWPPTRYAVDGILDV